MTTLFNKYLCEREFGSAVLHVETFQKWAVAKGLHLRTAPALGEYEFAQVEAILCAIERGAAPQTPEDARAIIDSKAELAGHTVAVRFPEPDHSHVWLVGADAHLQWRKLLERAIDACELQLLDGASYLPVSNRPAASFGAPESAEPAAPLLTKKQPITGVDRNRILAAFPPPPGTTDENWSKMLGTPPAWMLQNEARVFAGGPSVSALWNPAKFGMNYAERGCMTRKNVTPIIRREFGDWLPEWEMYTASFD